MMSGTRFGGLVEIKQPRFKTGALLTYEKHQLIKRSLDHGSVSPQRFSLHPVPPVLPDYLCRFPAKLILEVVNLVSSLFIDDLAKLGSVTKPEVDDLLLEDQPVTPVGMVRLCKFPEITNEYRCEPFRLIPAKIEAVLDILLHPVTDLAFLRCRVFRIALRQYHGTGDE